MAPTATSYGAAMIRENLDRYGYHVSLVAGGALPRYAYTIGMSAMAGAELILAGASFFRAQDVKRILDEAVDRVRTMQSLQPPTLQVEGLGSFSFRRIDASWAAGLMTSAIATYGGEVSAWQVRPDQEHWTLDIPDMCQPWSAERERVWRWMHEPWSYPVPDYAVATTNLDALRGRRITEAARWEVDRWELCAGVGSATPSDEIRLVPLATLLATDASLEAVIELKMGQALWRNDTGGAWQVWRV